MFTLKRDSSSGKEVTGSKASTVFSYSAGFMLMLTTSLNPALAEVHSSQPTAAATSTAVATPVTPTSDPASMRLVPAGTRVLVSPTDKISSATAQVGDIISVSATEDVIVNGYVVVPKGAGGQAEVASVERAHGNGGSGKLGIKMDWIAAIDGERILLTSTLKSASEEDRGGGSSTATILTYALLGPLGLFAHNFAHGKDVTIDQTKVLTAFTDSTVHVASTTVSQTPTIAH